MRKLLLSILGVVAIAGSVNAQCTPDPQYTQPGVYPDSATGLPPGYVGYAYDEVITVVVPSDTVVDVGFGPMSIPIDSIVMNSVTGLPPNFTYACNPSGCSFPGGSKGCVNLYSTQNPPIGDTGTYALNINVTAYATTPFGQQTDTYDIDYYSIEIKDSTGVNVSIQELTKSDLLLTDVYPNPVKDNARIQFVSGKNQEATFTITNLLGEVMERRILNAVKGVNTLNINTEKYPGGIYMYTIGAGNNVAAKRMIVSK